MIGQFLDTLFTSDFYHNLFFFLSTSSGILFRNTVELLLYSLLTYMIISEFRRSPRRELKYLIVAFMALWLKSVFLVVVYGTAVFGGLQISLLNVVLPVLSDAVNLFTLLVLTAAFLYPLYATKRVGRGIRHFIFVLCLVTVIIELLWISAFAEGAKYAQFWGNFVFEVLRLGIVVVALISILWHARVPFRYRQRVYLGFSIYLLSPLLNFLNWVGYRNHNNRLQLLEYPIPLFALVVFTSVIYLKLVDKAYLRDKLAESQKRLEMERESGKLKDEFVSMVSHELRTPLTAMKLYLSLLMKGKFGKISQKQRSALHTVEGENDRLTALINDILDISKFESNKAKLNLSKFDVIELNDPFFFTMVKDVQLERKFPKKLVVIADREKIKQVLLNLLSNAVKFTPESGRVTVQVKDTGKRWKLIVKDTGRGIPEDEVPRLFDKFYQVESHMTRDVKGTGLGLAIVKKIVELHSGTIEVKSKLGKGSTFTVTLPKQPESL